MQSTNNHTEHSYRHFDVKPLTGAMGAEVLGLDVNQLTDQSFCELQDALDAFQMLYIRDQPLSYNNYEVLTQRFGEFATDAFTKGIAGHPNIMRIAKRADEDIPLVFGGVWHTDSAFLSKPPSVTMLYAEVIPPVGGDTLFCSTYLAYDSLSDTMKETIAGLRGTYSMGHYTNTDGSLVRDYKNMAIDTSSEIGQASNHPLVRTHPRSGRKSLYANPGTLVGIEGMTEAEAEPLIRFLCDRVVDARFGCRLQWQPGTLALWDNRSTVHLALNDYSGFERSLLRTTVEGEVPF